MNVNISSNEIITMDGYLQFCLDNNLLYLKIDYFYIGPFLWRDKICSLNSEEKIIVVGHSDYSLTDDISNKFDLTFGTNNVSSNKNCYGLPIGICNDCDDHPIQKIHGNKEIMIKIMNEDIHKINLLYMNFEINTSLIERKRVFDLFSNKDWVLIGKKEDSIKGREKFLKEIKASKFVLCPRGNGIDTHRIWESLYMGSIPVVIYENVHKEFIDLPILFITDWSEINENFLNEKYEQMVKQQYNMEKLKISYWFNFIKIKIKELNESRNK